MKINQYDRKRRGVMAQNAGAEANRLCKLRIPPRLLETELHDAWYTGFDLGASHVPMEVFSAHCTPSKPVVLRWRGFIPATLRSSST